MCECVWEGGREDQEQIFRGKACQDLAQCVCLTTAVTPTMQNLPLCSIKESIIIMVDRNWTKSLLGLLHVQSQQSTYAIYLCNLSMQSTYAIYLCNLFMQSTTADSVCMCVTHPPVDCCRGTASVQPTLLVGAPGCCRHSSSHRGLTEGCRGFCTNQTDQVGSTSSWGQSNPVYNQQGLRAYRAAAAHEVNSTDLVHCHDSISTTGVT